MAAWRRSWLKDINRDFKGMNAVWNAWVDPAAKPARATVESAMARPVILVEIQATAARPADPPRGTRWGWW